jgi:Ca-activated chloride channel family protein
VATLQGGERLVAARRTRTVDLTLAVDVELVQVTATVTDRDGELVLGLLPRDFRVFEDGKRQQVSHFVGADEPREIVVAVDMSGSMVEAMPWVREAVRGFLAALRPDDRVTLLAFNDSIFTLARPDADPATRTRAIERLAAWGGTALHDVILKGYDVLDRIKGRKALVVFSDGDDESSRATVAEVEKRAERSDSPVYMIGQGRGTKEANLRRILDHLARMSGGRAFYTDQPDELQGVFATIVEELQSQYVLAYASTREGEDDAWHTIKVEAGEGRLVRARQGYRAGRRP